MRIVNLLTSLVAHASGAILYEGATILSFNDASQRIDVLEDSSLLIVGDTITQLSNGSIIRDIPADTTRVNATGKIIGPGYIDTHTYLWQTAFKTIGSNTSLADYFQKYGEFSQAEQYYTPEDVYLGQLAGSLERLHVGTTTVLDHAHASWSNDTTDAAVNGSFASDLRTFYAHAVQPIPNGWSWEAQIHKWTLRQKTLVFMRRVAF